MIKINQFLLLQSLIIVKTQVKLLIIKGYLVIFFLLLTIPSKDQNQLILLTMYFWPKPDMGYSSEPKTSIVVQKLLKHG